MVRALAAVLAALLMTGCTRKPFEPLLLEGNRLTVTNRTTNEWKHVEIWLNTYYRVTTDSILPDQRFQTTLDNFVAGFGQRFDFRKMQVKDLRLTATLPDGSLMNMRKLFGADGLGAVKPPS